MMEKTLQSLQPKDGLGGSEVWGIYIETSGIIWITARGSITRYDPSIPISNSKAFTVFTEPSALLIQIRLRLYGQNKYEKAAKR
jgi:hypothetical protein